MSLSLADEIGKVTEALSGRAIGNSTAYETNGRTTVPKSIRDETIIESGADLTWIAIQDDVIVVIADN